MSGRNASEQLERRLDDVRRSLRARHAGIEPDAHFADRVIARLPKDEGWTIAWAARRILPVSLAFAAVLMVAALATTRSSDRTIASTTRSTSTSAASQTGSDSLEWLLEGVEGRQ
jgi:hypothetical protein